MANHFATVEDTSFNSASSRFDKTFDLSRDKSNSLSDFEGKKCRPMIGRWQRFMTHNWNSANPENSSEWNSPTKTTQPSASCRKLDAPNADGTLLLSREATGLDCQQTIRKFKAVPFPPPELHRPAIGTGKSNSKTGFQHLIRRTKILLKKTCDRSPTIVASPTTIILARKTSAPRSSS